MIAAIEKSLLQLKKNYRILNIYNNSGGYSIKEIALLINKKIMNNTKLNFKINKVKKEHNPKNLKISNFSTKTSLKWHPKFDMNNLMNKLIKKDEIKKILNNIKFKNIKFVNYRDVKLVRKIRNEKKN